MYFEDMTPYSYSARRLAGDSEALINFGWLDSSHDYPKGEVDAQLVACTLLLATRYENGTCGFHRCQFCENPDQIMMQLGDESVYLGSAEIRIRSGDTTYVAPNMLPHYMAAHHYKPAAEILSVIEACCRDLDRRA